jgi:hypothetical protein
MPVARVGYSRSGQVLEVGRHLFRGDGVRVVWEAELE